MNKSAAIFQRACRGTPPVSPEASNLNVSPRTLRSLLKGLEAYEDSADPGNIAAANLWAPVQVIRLLRGDQQNEALVYCLIPELTKRVTTLCPFMINTCVLRQRSSFRDGCVKEPQLGGTVAQHMAVRGVTEYRPAKKTRIWAKTGLPTDPAAETTPTCNVGLFQYEQQDYRKKSRPANLPAAESAGRHVLPPDAGHNSISQAS